MRVRLAEHEILMVMMELLVRDFAYSGIASDLNEKGYRMRNGEPWSRVAVFNMVPRLIEVGPWFSIRRSGKRGGERLRK